MAKQRWLDVDGVILFDKPSGLSSNGALQKVRRLYQAAKAGHTGTLDPMASGLLPVCLGEATKFSQMLLEADKSYVARVRLGETTNTGDAEGEIVQRRQVDVTEAGIDQVLERFIGEISQIPPMYSALKRDGKPLYAYARAGVDIEREPRRVTISGLKRGPLENQEFELFVSCSKGTYIRTLAEDIGNALGCGAHITALRRTAIGPFTLDQAVTLEGLESGEEARRQSLLATDLLARHLPVLDLSEDEAGRIRHGQALLRREQGEGDVRIYANNEFLGLGRWQPGFKLIPLRLLSESSAKCHELDVKEKTPL